MKPVKFQRETCKGCLLCTTVCPAKIISQSKKSNSKGYFTAEVIEEKLDECKQCGFCTLICPDAAIIVQKKKGDA